MDMRTLKNAIIEALLNRGVYIRRISPIQFVTRCPSCGDSRKHDDGHLYIRINPDDNYPIIYNCFKCPFGGVMDAEAASMLGIDSDGILNNISNMNKSATPVKQMLKDDNKQFEWVIPEPVYGDKIKYVEERLGLKLDNENNRFRIITSLRDFMIANQLKEISVKPHQAKKLDTKYVGFLSSNGAYILFRDVTDTEEKFRWVKYKVDPHYSGTSRTFYSLSREVDIFTDDTIIINMAEGVMDIISVAINLDYDLDNVINVAVLGNKYSGMLRYLISKGFVGSNYIINVFSDNDGTKETSLKFLTKVLIDFKALYGEINIIYNVKSKDCGVRKEDIVLKKFKL